MVLERNTGQEIKLIKTSLVVLETIKKSYPAQQYLVQIVVTILEQFFLTKQLLIQPYVKNARVIMIKLFVIQRIPTSVSMSEFFVYKILLFLTLKLMATGANGELGQNAPKIAMVEKDLGQGRAMILFHNVMAKSALVLVLNPRNVMNM